jgi:hypothetical protein
VFEQFKRTPYCRKRITSVGDRDLCAFPTCPQTGGCGEEELLSLWKIENHALLDHIYTQEEKF